MQSQRRGQDNVVSSLNVAIEAANLTKEILSVTPAKAVCGSISVILLMIRVRSLHQSITILTDCGLKHIQDSMVNETDYVGLGLACAEVCTALERGMNGKRLDDLNRSVRNAIAQLTT